MQTDEKTSGRREIRMRNDWDEFREIGMNRWGRRQSRMKRDEGGGRG